MNRPATGWRFYTGFVPAALVDCRWALTQSRLLTVVMQTSPAAAPPRVLECPVHMEGIVHDFRPFGKNVNANVPIVTLLE